MIVIVVVGVLTAVALPQFLGVQKKAEINAEIAEFVGLAKECSAAVSIDGPWPVNYVGIDVGDGEVPGVNSNCNGGGSTAAEQKKNSNRA